MDPGAASARMSMPKRCSRYSCASCVRARRYEFPHGAPTEHTQILMRARRQTSHDAVTTAGAAYLLVAGLELRAVARSGGPQIARRDRHFARFRVVDRGVRSTTAARVPVCQERHGKLAKVRVEPAVCGALASRRPLCALLSLPPPTHTHKRKHKHTRTIGIRRSASERVRGVREKGPRVLGQAEQHLRTKCAFSHAPLHPPAYTDTPTPTQTHRHTDTDTGTDRQTDTHTQTHRHRHIHTHTHTDTHRHTHTQAHTGTCRMLFM